MRGAATPLLARLGQEPLAAVLTEREVAELAARGRTSRDIAEALGVSVRTVHSHLHQAYAKLGIGDRGELAALAGARRRGRPCGRPPCRRPSARQVTGTMPKSFCAVMKSWKISCEPPPQKPVIVPLAITASDPLRPKTGPPLSPGIPAAPQQ